jgi:hypothetical protein
MVTSFPYKDASFPDLIKTAKDLSDDYKWGGGGAI